MSKELEAASGSFRRVACKPRLRRHGRARESHMRNDLGSEPREGHAISHKKRAVVTYKLCAWKDEGIDGMMLLGKNEAIVAVWLYYVIL